MAKQSKAKPITKGAEIGVRLRARATTLTRVQRRAARLRGMQLIRGHGGGMKPV